MIRERFGSLASRSSGVPRSPQPIAVRRHDGCRARRRSSGASGTGWSAGGRLGDGGTVLRAWVWLVIGRLDAGHPAARHVGGSRRSVTDLMILIANVASLAAVAAVVLDSHSTERRVPPLRGPAGAGVGRAVLDARSDAFHLRFATPELYDSPAAGRGCGGRDRFQPGRPPQYTDFAYLATSLGMTYQVSDTHSATTRSGPRPWSTACCPTCLARSSLP